MPSIPAILASKLARQAEAKLRYEGSSARSGTGWQSMTMSVLGRWLWKSAGGGSPFTLGQYTTIARQVIRNARDAATMQQNPQLTILNLGTAPGVPATFPTFEYKSLVVAYDINGNEVTSRLIYTYSGTELSGQQVEADARNQFLQPLRPPGMPDYPDAPSNGIVDVRVFILGAGHQ